MNLYEAGLEAAGTLVLGSQRLELPADVATRVAACRGSKVLVGIRPEDLTVTGSGSALVADVRFVEVLGSEQHVYFSIDATSASTAGGAAAVVADDSAEASILLGGAPNGAARLDPRVAVQPGGRITFVVDPARLYFFDPDTGRAITG
jgi:multiple sugar transport system ATP-binding protein